MRKTVVYLWLAALVLMVSCSNGQAGKMEGGSEQASQPAKTDLSAAEFSQKIKELPSALILDVRTPEEFASGHLSNALNIDWNGSDFEQQVAKLDRQKPVLVYCLAGSRSAEAASHLREMGFQEVYELDGGILKWRAAGLTESVADGPAKIPGMTREQYNNLFKTDKLVLIDFYAEWCVPCKKMKPFLEEIAKEQKDKVEVVRIDADANRELSKELGVEALPSLMLYKNNTVRWKSTGYVGKEEMLKQIQTHEMYKTTHQKLNQ